MGSIDKKKDEQQRRPHRSDDEAYDAVELTDEDLEYVVGGLSLDAVMARASYLRQAWGED